MNYKYMLARRGEYKEGEEYVVTNHLYNNPEELYPHTSVRKEILKVIRMDNGNFDDSTVRILVVETGYMYAEARYLKTKQQKTEALRFVVLIILATFVSHVLIPLINSIFN